VSERKFIVPKGMMEAASAAFRPIGGGAKEAVEAALRWLSENPIVPTDEQIHEMYPSASEAGISFTLVARFIAEWQRRMFIAPEPEFRDKLCTRPGCQNESQVNICGTPFCSDCDIEIRKQRKRTGITGPVAHAEWEKRKLMVSNAEREESEVLEDVLDELLLTLEIRRKGVYGEAVEKAIIEAYRRGQKDGKQ